MVSTVVEVVERSSRVGDSIMLATLCVWHGLPHGRGRSLAGHVLGGLVPSRLLVGYGHRNSECELRYRTGFVCTCTAVSPCIATRLCHPAHETSPPNLIHAHTPLLDRARRIRPLNNPPLPLHHPSITCHPRRRRRHSTPTCCSS